MRIFVTGGTGFVGTPLVNRLRGAGHTVVLLLRPGERPLLSGEGILKIEGDSLAPGPWMVEAGRCDCAINMAGEPIFGRWTAEKKRGILESRVKTTANLVAAIPAGKSYRLLSTSAVGFYGDAGERELEETAPAGGDFLAGVAKAWEAQAQKAAEKGASVTLMRFGIVMGKNGGALAQLVNNTLKFIGGPVGGGKQFFSWIHLEDLTAAILFLLEHPELTGPVNLCAPNPLRQAETAKVLGKLLHRPSFIPAPALAVRLALGEFADVALFSQRMIPRRLADAGFRWRYPDFEGAVTQILKG